MGKVKGKRRKVKGVFEELVFNLAWCSPHPKHLSNGEGL